MKVGLAAIYSWRPHVEHLHYVASLLREAGHQTHFLTCDSDLPTCYTRELRPNRSDLMHCVRCRAGGIRSFSSKNVSRIGALADPRAAVPESARVWALSSASTLGRFESDAEFQSEEFRELATQLEAGTRRTYAAAQAWIEKEGLDAICVFNGRMDATRAVLEAARAAGIPFVSLERTWFGDGLQLLPGENCLGLRSIHRMTAEWSDTPLTRDQALRAIGKVASRFLRNNTNEWRAYNVTARHLEWPADGHRRVLLTPGSRSEVWGHPDWESGWPERTVALDAVIEHLGLRPEDVVLRCHPNWGENIGLRDGRRSEQYYTEWAKRRGIRVIASRDQTSTLGLIEQADAVVLCGGSAALEAGILGKQVIATTPSIYHRAGFQSDADSPEALAKVTLHAALPESDRRRTEALIAQRTLRYAYTMVYRVPQYVDHVRCVTTTRVEYREGADPERVVKLLRGGALQPDDHAAGDDPREEEKVLASVARRDWQQLLSAVPAQKLRPRRSVGRRILYRPIDRLRDVFPRGDR